MPEVTSPSVPSLWTMCIVPDTITPTWCAWHESVPTTGLMHSDHRQPGSTFKRPALMPARSTTSTLVLSGERTSSGESKLFAMNPGMAPPSETVLKKQSRRRSPPLRGGDRSMGSAPRLQHEVHRRLRRPPELRESGFLEHLAEPRLAGLRAESEAHLLGERVGRADRR